MNKRKKVAWHKHLAAAKKHKAKAKAQRTAGTAQSVTAAKRG
jgi:hypothetical protein